MCVSRVRDVNAGVERAVDLRAEFDLGRLRVDLRAQREAVARESILLVDQSRTRATPSISVPQR
jgi:hypothetical protein